MYLLTIFKRFSGNILEFLKDYHHSGQAYQEKDSSGQEYQDPMKLGIAAVTNSREAFVPHARKLLELGAAPEEIAHLVLLSLTLMGSPNRIASLYWVNEFLKKDFQEK